MKKKKITPVTVVTGHLGSGKTTFIQKVLKAYPEKNFLIIENEFGEVGIDGEILKNDQNALVELNNGCVCCNIQSDLEEILQKFLLKDEKIDHIIIEATGVANPAKIAKQFIPPQYLSDFFNLLSVLCIVDGVNYKKHQELPEFELQLLTSDRYYISKSEDPTQAIDDLSLSPNQIIESEKNLDWFFEKTFFELDSTISQKGGHNHYQKISIELTGEFDPFTLENYLNVLFMQYMGRIFRSKGLIHFRKNPNPYIFQGVFDSLDFQEIEGTENKVKKNSFIFIGEGLNEEKIYESLQNCIE